jgi:hypothetical protein
MPQHCKKIEHSIKAIGLYPSMERPSLIIPNTIFDMNTISQTEERLPLSFDRTSGFAFQPSIIIPPLDTQSLVQYSGADVRTPPVRRRQAEPQTPPPVTRPNANRFHTPCSVERIVHGTVSHVYWFGDFQLAWLWIEGRARDTPQNEWDLVPFQQAANSIEQRWENGLEGKVVASCEDIRYKVFFEPGQEDEVRAFEQRVEARRRAQEQDEQTSQVVEELMRHLTNNP